MEKTSPEHSTRKSRIILPKEVLHPEKLAIDNFQGDIMTRDYFKVDVQHCVLLNEQCLNSFRLDEKAYYKDGIEGKPPFDCRVCLRSRERRISKSDMKKRD